MRWRPWILAVLVLGGCKPKAAEDAAAQAPRPAPPAASANGDSAAAAGSAGADAPGIAVGAPPQLAYSFTYALMLPGDRIHGLIGKDEAACQAAGPAACQITGEDEVARGASDASARLELRAAPVWLARFRAGLDGETQAAGGRIAHAQTETQDLGRAIVDTQAQIRAKTALEARLEGLVATRTGQLSDVLDAERELARVQGEIDAARSEVAAMQGQVMMSDVSIDYRAIGIGSADGAPSPLEAAAAGFWSNVQASLAAILTLASFGLPFGLVAVPLGWLAWRFRSGRRPAQAASRA